MDSLAISKLKEISTRDFDPSPKSPPTFYYYPPDNESITGNLVQDNFPIMIYSLAVNERNRVQRVARDLSTNLWNIEGMLFLYQGLLSNDEIIANAETDVPYYVRAMDSLLMKNHTLGGTVESVGAPGQLPYFEYHIGHINWFDDIHWGIKFVVPISQSFEH